MKACPGPRSGIDGSGRLLLVVRGIPSSIRRLVYPAPHFVIPAKAGIQEWGGGNVVRSKTTRGEGLVPRWGRGGEWQNPPCQFAEPTHDSRFSSLGVPAQAGMSDWYENGQVQ